VRNTDVNICGGVVGLQERNDGMIVVKYGIDVNSDCSSFIQEKKKE
jgi:hypothetical protein